MNPISSQQNTVWNLQQTERAKLLKKKVNIILNEIKNRNLPENKIMKFWESPWNYRNSVKSVGDSQIREHLCKHTHQSSELGTTYPLEKYLSKHLN